MPDLKARFKSMFDTPQKARTAGTCLVVALATLAAVIVYIVYIIQNYGLGAPEIPGTEVSEPVSTAPEESTAPEPSEAPSEPPALMGTVPTLTIDQARELALADAGVSEDDAEVTREALEEDNGIWVYTFRFLAGQIRYEYMINANTGAVRSMIREVIASPGAEPSESVSPSIPGENAPPEASAPEQSAPQASSATDSTEAPSGSQALDSPPPSSSPSPTPSQPGTMYVGMDRARTIALDHAGLTNSQVTFTRLRMGREGGAMVYELRFRQGQTEYAYKIDATSGRILSHESGTR